jgi:hypothetical protein
MQIMPRCAFSLGGDALVMVGMREQSRNGFLDSGAVFQDLVPSSTFQVQSCAMDP